MADPTPDPRLLSEEDLANIRARSQKADVACLGAQPDVIICVQEGVPLLLTHIAAQQEEIERLRQIIDKWRSKASPAYDWQNDADPQYAAGWKDSNRQLRVYMNELTADEA